MRKVIRNYKREEGVSRIEREVMKIERKEVKEIMKKKKK